MPDSEYVLGKGHEGFLQLLICFDENIIKQVLDSTKKYKEADLPEFTERAMDSKVAVWKHFPD